MEQFGIDKGLMIHSAAVTAAVLGIGYGIGYALDKVIPKSERLYSEHGGIWRKQVEAGQRVKKGAVLGEVANLFGEPLQTVTAPFDGVANVIKTYYEVNAGDTLLYLVKV